MTRYYIVLAAQQNILSCTWCTGTALKLSVLMHWPEIFFIVGSEDLFSEMLCINETHFKAAQKAKKKSLKLIGKKKKRKRL